MLIAVDKDSLKAVKSNNNYVYLFDNESLEDLLNLNMHCMYYKELEFADINLTNYDIDCFKKASINDEDYDKLPEKINYKIGIIIPNYNYEHTIEKCLTSVFNQTYKNWEIIFVDDMSTDNSVQLASKLYGDYLDEQNYNSNFGEMKIIKLKQKRLNGGARNEAYLHLSEDVDYVWYVDSDDWLYDETALEKINNKLQKKPDVLFVGMAQFKNDSTTTSYIPNYKNKYEAIRGWSGSCGKVIKKSLATRQECLYNEGTLKEDRNQHCRICIYMKSFAILKDMVYVWNRENHKSVTTLRDEIGWKTSTIRHYADTMQLCLTYKDEDKEISKYLKERLKQCEDEIKTGGDRQW